MKFTLPSFASLACSSLFLLAAPCVAQPIVSDDTSTQGKGKSQFEIDSEFSTFTTSREQLWTPQLTYGVTDRIDFSISAPYQHIKPDLQASAQGFTDPAISLKWQFYQENGLSFGIKPSVTLPFGNDKNGLGNGRLTYQAMGIMEYEIGDFKWLVNAGYTRNNNVLGNRKNILGASAAALYQLNEKTALAVEYGINSHQDLTVSQPEEFALTGMMYSPNDSVDFNFGYKRGLNRQSLNHAWLAGITLHW